MEKKRAKIKEKQPHQEATNGTLTTAILLTSRPGAQGGWDGWKSCHLQDFHLVDSQNVAQDHPLPLWALLLHFYLSPISSTFLLSLLFSSLSLLPWWENQIYSLASALAILVFTFLDSSPTPPSLMPWLVLGFFLCWILEWPFWTWSFQGKTLGIDDPTGRSGAVWSSVVWDLYRGHWLQFLDHFFPRTQVCVSCVCCFPSGIERGSLDNLW